MCQLLGMSSQGGWNRGSFFIDAMGQDSWMQAWFPFFGLLITLSSAWRLARFNIDENQVDSFIGLPTPANALLILSLPLILLYNGSEGTNALILNTWFLAGLTLLSAILLNAPIRLFALKFKGWGFRENGLKYLFLVVALVLILTLQYLGIPLVILSYILFSLGMPKASAQTEASE